MYRGTFNDPQNATWKTRNAYEENPYIYGEFMHKMTPQ